MALPRILTAPAGVVSRTIGRATDLLAPEGSLLDQSAQYYYDVGNNITDKNTVYTGSLVNPFSSIDNASSWQTVSNPAGDTGGTDQNVVTDDSSINGGATGGTTSSRPTYNADDLRFIDDSIGQLRDYLQRLETAKSKKLIAIDELFAW